MLIDSSPIEDEYEGKDGLHYILEYWMGNKIGKPKPHHWYKGANKLVICGPTCESTAVRGYPGWSIRLYGRQWTFDQKKPSYLGKVAEGYSNRSNFKVMHLFEVILPHSAQSFMHVFMCSSGWPNWVGSITTLEFQRIVNIINLLDNLPLSFFLCFCGTLKLVITWADCCLQLYWLH